MVWAAASPVTSSNKVPSALTNPAYITLCLAFGVLGYLLAYGKGQLFREGLFQFMTSFSLPWYAVIGAIAGIGAGIPVLGSLLLAVVGPTAGRFYIDASVMPKQFIKGEWFVGIAALTGAVWMVLDAMGLGHLAGGARSRRLRVRDPARGPLPRLGGTHAAGAEGRLPAQRRAAAPRSQDRRQVAARDA